MVPGTLKGFRGCTLEAGEMMGGCPSHTDMEGSPLHGAESTMGPLDPSHLSPPVTVGEGSCLCMRGGRQDIAKPGTPDR